MRLCIFFFSFCFISFSACATFVWPIFSHKEIEGHCPIKFLNISSDEVQKVSVYQGKHYVFTVTNSERNCLICLLRSPNSSFTELPPLNEAIEGREAVYTYNMWGMGNVDFNIQKRDATEKEIENWAHERIIESDSGSSDSEEDFE